MGVREILQRNLTEEQRQAAVDPSNEVLCLACAGSGKSRTLAYRIARLLVEGEAPQSIVAFTFTEKAAESIKRRVSETLSATGLSANAMGAMYIGTIHSYCQSVLGNMDAVFRQFDILDENRLKLSIISRFGRIGLARLRPRAHGGSYFDTVKRLSDSWKTLNDEMLTVDAVQREDPDLGQALAALRDNLRQDQFIDFSLMIRLVVDALLRRDDLAREAVGSLRHLMVDEYQDVSPSREELIRQLHDLSESLFVVRDDDQSIYAWRGADVSNILNFRDRYPDASAGQRKVTPPRVLCILELRIVAKKGGQAEMRDVVSQLGNDCASWTDGDLAQTAGRVRRHLTLGKAYRRSQRLGWVERRCDGVWKMTHKRHEVAEKQEAK